MEKKALNNNPEFMKYLLAKYDKYEVTEFETTRTIPKITLMAKLNDFADIILGDSFYSMLGQGDMFVLRHKEYDLWFTLLKQTE